MTLNKDTKACVQRGDLLRFADGKVYRVHHAEGNKRGGYNYTIEDTETKQTIYFYPASKLYGAEIVKDGDAHIAFIREMNDIGDFALGISNIIGNLEFDRENEDTWTDVATLRSIKEKLTDISVELLRYADNRLPE